MSVTVFIECVSCGAELELWNGPMDDRTAARRAHRKGWTIKGFYGAKHTRCLRCRRARRTDTQALTEGRVGHRAGGQTTGRARP